MTTDDTNASTARRGYQTALALLALGAVVMFLSYGRTWITATAGGSGLPSLTFELTGRDLQPAATALPVLALAGIAGVVATRRIGRVISGVVLVAAGVGGVVLPTRFGLTWSHAEGEGATIDRIVGERIGVAVSHAPAHASAWWIVAALGGLLVLVGGALVVARGAGWASMGGRYERAAADRPRASESAWDQLDRGVDPTADGVTDATVTPSGPSGPSGPSDAEGGSGDPMLGSGPRA